MEEIMDVFRKALNTGVGMISLGREAIERSAKQISEDLKMSEAEGKKLVDEMVEKSEEAKNDLKVKIDEAIDEALKEMGLVKKSEFDDLKRRMDDLEKEMKGDEYIDAEVVEDKE